jgi:hypothetical protein
MKSRIWRLAGVGMLCLSIGAQALAEGPQDQPRGNPGGGQQGRGPDAGQHGGGQGRPQGGNDRGGQGQGQGQWQGGRGNDNQPRTNLQRQEQMQREQGSRDNQQPRTNLMRQQEQQGRPATGLPIQGKPDEVRQTQQPIRGNYPDLRPNDNRHWEAGGPGQRPGNNWQGGGPRPGDNRPGYNRPGDNHWQGGGRGNGWGPGPQYRPGYVIDRFPGQNYRVPYRGQDYFFSDGYWYRPQGPRYVVVRPPYGVRVRYLPDYAERMWIGSAMFFLAAGTYYQYQANTQEYIVVNPPVASPQPIQQASNGYDVAAYPANGQTLQQIDQDRYECQRWATQQSGFDPAQATYAPAPEVVNIYRQNLANCYVSRGYTVN